MKFELESYKADIKKCPRCGGSLEFTTVFRAYVSYKIDPKTGRIGKKPNSVCVSEDDGGIKSHYCRNCNEDVEFMDEAQR